MENILEIKGLKKNIKIFLCMIFHFLCQWIVSLVLSA